MCTEGSYVRQSRDVLIATSPQIRPWSQFPGGWWFGEGEKNKFPIYVAEQVVFYSVLLAT